MPQVNLQQENNQRSGWGARSKTSVVVDRSTYCNPNKLNVNSAIRIDSDFPLIEGEPTHRAACGMLTTPASTKSIQQYPHFAMHQSDTVVSGCLVKPSRNSLVAMNPQSPINKRSSCVCKSLAAECHQYRFNC